MWLDRALRWFCLHCSHPERLPGETDTDFLCLNTRCLFWDYHRSGLGRLAPEDHVPVAVDVDALRQEHARAIAGFRGRLPELPPNHDWDADAKFNGLFPASGETAGSAPAMR